MRFSLLREILLSIVLPATCSATSRGTVDAFSAWQLEGSDACDIYVILAGSSAVPCSRDCLPRPGDVRDRILVAALGDDALESYSGREAVGDALRAAASGLWSSSRCTPLSAARVSIRSCNGALLGSFPVDGDVLRQSPGARLFARPVPGAPSPRLLVRADEVTGDHAAVAAGSHPGPSTAAVTAAGGALAALLGVVVALMLAPAKRRGGSTPPAAGGQGGGSGVPGSSPRGRGGSGVGIPPGPGHSPPTAAAAATGSAGGAPPAATPLFVPLPPNMEPPTSRGGFCSCLCPSRKHPVVAGGDSGGAGMGMGGKRSSRGSMAPPAVAAQPPLAAAAYGLDPSIVLEMEGGAGGPSPQLPDGAMSASEWMQQRRLRNAAAMRAAHEAALARMQSGSSAPGGGAGAVSVTSASGRLSPPPSDAALRASRSGADAGILSARSAAATPLGPGDHGSPALQRRTSFARTIILADGRVVRRIGRDADADTLASARSPAAGGSVGRAGHGFVPQSSPALLPPSQRDTDWNLLAAVAGAEDGAGAVFGSSAAPSARGLATALPLPPDGSGGPPTPPRTGGALPPPPPMPPGLTSLNRPPLSVVSGTHAALPAGQGSPRVLAVQLPPPPANSSAPGPGQSTAASAGSTRTVGNPLARVLDLRDAAT